MKNKIFLILAAALLISLKGYAQSMSMQMGVMPKNTYLMMMDTMMNKMGEVSAPLSVESDFNRQMVAHHEGAVAMSRYEIRHGKNFTMIQLAKSILAEQLVEIQQMNIWLATPQIKRIIPVGYSRDMPLTMDAMMKTMPRDSDLKSLDRAFAAVMIPHHRAAVAMARVLLTYSNEMQITSFAKQLISNEEIEIEQMSAYLK